MIFLLVFFSCPKMILYDVEEEIGKMNYPRKEQFYLLATILTRREAELIELTSQVGPRSSASKCIRFCLCI